MSPAAALQSSVFLTYLAITVALLLAAAAALVVLQYGLRKDVHHAWESLRGWLIMVPLVVGCIFLGRVATIAFFTLAAITGFKEFARATGLYRDWPMTGVVHLGIVSLGLVALVTDPVKDVAGWYGLFMALPVYVIAVILMIPIIRNRTEGQLQAIALAIVGFLYIGWMFGHLSFLANAGGRAYGYLLYLIFAVQASDVAAFTFGKLFGRHRLRSQISPNKTWEGSLGALAVSLALPWLLRFSFPHFTPLHCILAGVIVGIGGQLGDLSISVIKRDLGIKDMGALIRGHGGVLDRIDSLIYVAPLFFHMTRYFHDLY
jgi:phosphatidate cytidylyltransferase